MSGPARLTHDRWAKIGGRMDKQFRILRTDRISHIPYTDSLCLAGLSRCLPDRESPRQRAKFLFLSYPMVSLVSNSLISTSRGKEGFQKFQIHGQCMSAKYNKKKQLGGESLAEPRRCSVRYFGPTWRR